ncbi:MAG: HAMP domain-containing histidine kinase [Ruminococcus sp.]|nr:HAMP domain-containing histidine kinase [Ruminococcus sp.]
MVIVIFCAMAAAIILLLTKLHLMKKAAREIHAGFQRSLSEDTNTAIRLSTRDKDMRELAGSINVQIRKLREEHLLYHQGNSELKNAITNISHDIRTPLTAIYGYLDMLQNTSDPEKQERYIAIMKERAELMKQLTEELFRYSVILSDESEMVTEEVFVNKLLAESITGFYPALSEKGIVPEISITDKHILRLANEAALSRVFVNLLSNAVKYSAGDLKITLDDSGTITFSNTSMELSAVEVQQLFNRFYTVESASHSTGLGLSIARTLIERMGGSISAEYESGRLIICIML